VQEKIRKGVEQLKTRAERKSLLVLNIESPDCTVEEDLLAELRSMVAEQSAVTVDVVFLCCFHWVG
jgi:hypothetical protein